MAPGSYIADSGAINGAVDTLSGGTWTAATAPLPLGAATTKDAYLEWAACPLPGNCVAVGTYTAQDGGTQALIETATGKHGQAARPPPGRIATVNVLSRMDNIPPSPAATARSHKQL